MRGPTRRCRFLSATVLSTTISSDEAHGELREEVVKRDRKGEVQAVDQLGGHLGTPGVTQRRRGKRIVGPADSMDELKERHLQVSSIRVAGSGDYRQSCRQRHVIWVTPFGPREVDPKRAR